MIYLPAATATTLQEQWQCPNTVYEACNHFKVGDDGPYHFARRAKLEKLHRHNSWQS